MESLLFSWSPSRLNKTTSRWSWSQLLETDLRFDFCEVWCNYTGGLFQKYSTSAVLRSHGTDEAADQRVPPRYCTVQSCTRALLFIYTDFLTRFSWLGTQISHNAFCPLFRRSSCWKYLEKETTKQKVPGLKRKEEEWTSGKSCVSSCCGNRQLLEKIPRNETPLRKTPLKWFDFGRFPLQLASLES